MARLTKRKLLSVLRDAFGDVEDALEVMPERITGAIVSSAFDDMNHEQRQKKLKRVLREKLNAIELQQVSAIVGLTPAERYVKA